MENRQSDLFSSDFPAEDEGTSLTQTFETKSTGSKSEAFLEDGGI